MEIIDFAASKIPPHEIRDAGYAGVVAYVSESRTGANLGAKPITREYADALRDEGLHIVSNFQYGKPGGSAPSDFTRGFYGGAEDAHTALRLHEAAGGPDSAPIMFSIDEDINLATWNGVGVEWFRGINSVLGVDRSGIYGHSRVCAWAIEDGVVGYSTSDGKRWVWQTKAWSFGAREPAAVLYQRVIDTPSNPGPLVGGVHVDVNDVLAADFGQWELLRPLPPTVPDFDESTEIPSPYYGSRGGTKVLWFVLHTEDGNSTSARQLARYLENNPNHVSYHYTLDNQGHVFNVVDTRYYANSVLQPGNSKSINLAFSGSWASWPRQAWFDRMHHGMDIAAYIAVRDARRYGLQPRVISPEEARQGQTGITDHNGVRIATGVGTHTDVGAGFPWDYFIQKVNEYAAIAPRPPAVTTGPTYPGQPIMPGVTGRHVAMIQDRLNTVANAGLLVDGEFGPLTTAAVTAFQNSRGLVPDGEVGPQTWAELFADPRDLPGDSVVPRIVLTSSTAPKPEQYPLPGGSCSGQTAGPAETSSIPADDETQPSITGLRLQRLRGWGTRARDRSRLTVGRWLPHSAQPVEHVARLAVPRYAVQDPRPGQGPRRDRPEGRYAPAGQTAKTHQKGLTTASLGVQRPASLENAAPRAVLASSGSGPIRIPLSSSPIARRSSSLSSKSNTSMFC